MSLYHVNHPRLGLYAIVSAESPWTAIRLFTDRAKSLTADEDIANHCLNLKMLSPVSPSEGVLHMGHLGELHS